MLMLCITGLPLIFYEQIDELLHGQVEAAVVPEATPPVCLDCVAAGAVDPNAMLVSVGKSIDANPVDNRIVRIRSPYRRLSRRA